MLVISILYIVTLVAADAPFYITMLYHLVCVVIITKTKKYIPEGL